MKTVAAVLFPNFELLDLAGPLEMFGNLREQVRVVPVAGQLALLTEYEWHRDPAWDPFAKAHGLVS